MVCISLELGPLLNGFRVGLERLSGDEGRSVGLFLGPRPITVPKRLRPPKPLGFRSCAAFALISS